MIVLCGEYRLTSNRYGWIIHKRTILGARSNTPGEVRWKEDQPAFPSSLANGLQMIYERLLKEHGEVDISDLAQICRDTVVVVEKQMQKVRTII